MFFTFVNLHTKNKKEVFINDEDYRNFEILSNGKKNFYGPIKSRDQVALAIKKSGYKCRDVGFDWQGQGFVFRSVDGDTIQVFKNKKSSAKFRGKLVAV